MKAVIQRVKQAKVEVDNQVVGQIAKGYLVLLGVEKEDTQATADKLLAKLLKLRINEDENGKMNLNILDAQGSLLVVSQFTLCADTSRGNRPSFNGAPPALANELYEYFSQQARAHLPVENGVFAADMQVFLQNDGPVTFVLEVEPSQA
ncbi:D-tyrosyl-tRNA(Tyr) deacylase [Psittacicella melopsittaci]|uniref:D-aminoacyl-tRNA deacylase n=1 Tax=Psittacicella melopsittaci TaxID=2028576 RepID=A0A3A1YBX4_9GAMM|nr:D-aminoacyl-tRNA deacylase [Psittacicella melopsittaci]RIY33714.1 D-tyrosyl-tRNA(Tyr) deacylase [Psittacicella melopsittaci]